MRAIIYSHSTALPFLICIVCVLINYKLCKIVLWTFTFILPFGNSTISTIGHASPTELWNSATAPTDEGDVVESSGKNKP